jgi:hypothetical protein
MDTQETSGRRARSDTLHPHRGGALRVRAHFSGMNCLAGSISQSGYIRNLG